MVLQKSFQYVYFVLKKHLLIILMFEKFTHTLVDTVIGLS